MTRPGRGPGRRRRALGHRALVAAAVAVALAAGVAGCDGGTASAGSATTTSNPADPWVAGLGGTLSVGIDRAPTGCNPNSATGDTWANRLVLEPVLPSAFFVGPGGTATYDSAVITQAEVVSTTPQTVVYTLNPDAVWSDGVPITAADFVYAWHQQRGTTPGGTGSGDDVASTLGYRRIKSVTGTNHGRTVTVVFRTPFADWKMLFDDLLPAHVMEQQGWDPGCTTVDPAIDLSGGPYEIGSVDQGHEVTLVRNPHWWEAAPYLDRIVVRTASGADQLATWLDHHVVQVAQPSSFGPAFLASVASRPSVESSSQISSTFLQLEYSTTSPVTGQLAVREAVSHAVDRQAMVNELVGPINTSIVPASSHLFSQGQTGYPAAHAPPLQQAAQPGSSPPSTSPTPTPQQPWPLGADAATSARELEDAGYVQDPTGTWLDSSGQPLVLRLAVDTGDGWAEAAGDVLVRQLRQQGITVTVVAAPDAKSAGLDLANGQADAAVIPFDATPYPSQAIAWYTTLLGAPGVGGSQDWSNFYDPTLNATLVKASQELNPDDAAPLYTQADTTLWEQMVALPLFAEPSALAWSAYAAGVGPNPNGPGLLWSTTTWGLRVPATSPDTAPG
ncbi:MAG: ABC transporter family substrate-binding protein [Acidimicrobiales bacterium]